MDAVVEIIGISGGDVPSYNENTNFDDSGQRLHCRVVLTQENAERRYVDSITMTLQGVLHSTIGSKTAIERLLYLRQQKHYSEFEPRASSKGQRDVSGKHIGFTFELPKTIIPSLDLSGTTSITRSSALADRHHIAGHSEVRYWLDVEFKSSDLVIRRLTCPVDFAKLMKPSQMTVLADGRLESTRKPVQVRRRGLSFRRNSGSLPDMTFEVPHELGVVASSPKTNGSGHQHLSIPLTISAPEIDSDSARIPTSLDNVSVRVHWHTSKSFGTSRLAPHAKYTSETIVRKTTVVKQTASVTFPPFFSDNKTTERTSYSSTTGLDLILPETIRDSSITTDLVRISYDLELQASFDTKLSNGKSVGCRSTLQIPLEVHMT